MASSTRSEMLREREEERRLNMRTLVIASVASATAAAVTSQLWIRGTWIAAALTPALVALISEAMHRPTERIARAWTSDGPALGAGASRHADEPAPADQPLPPRSAREPLSSRAGPEPAAGPVRVYRQPSDRAPRRKIALGVVAATAAIAFVIAVTVLTAGDLISGGSIGKGGGSTTLFSTSAKKKQPQQDAKPTQTTPEQTSTSEPPPPTTETTPEQQPSDTAPTTPLPESPPGEPTPDATP
jgi:eukaryotic-like serine/threonine-protein kinase